MTDFLGILLNNLPPLRCFLDKPARPKVVIYTDAQHSDKGRKGVGVIVLDTETGNRLICGSEIPQDVLDWISSVQGHSSNVNHCELLAVLVAIMTFPDVLQGRNILLFTDNLTVLRSLVHGYMRTPELGAMSNAIHLALAGLEAQYHALHVPGAANPADIPSRVPFIHQDGEFVLDPAKLLNGKTGKADTETIRKLQASHRPAVFPTSTQLDDITTFVRGTA